MRQNGDEHEVSHFVFLDMTIVVLVWMSAGDYCTQDGAAYVSTVPADVKNLLRHDGQWRLQTANNELTDWPQLMRLMASARSGPMPTTWTFGPIACGTVSVVMTSSMAESRIRWWANGPRMAWETPA